MDNKQAFSDYIAKRQAEYKKEQIAKMKRLDNILNSHAIESSERMRRSYKSRKRAVN